MHEGGQRRQKKIKEKQHPPRKTYALHLSYLSLCYAFPACLDLVVWRLGRSKQPHGYQKKSVSPQSPASWRLGHPSQLSVPAARKSVDHLPLGCKNSANTDDDDDDVCTFVPSTEPFFSIQGRKAGEPYKKTVLAMLYRVRSLSRLLRSVFIFGVLFFFPAAGGDLLEKLLPLFH